MSPTRSSSRSPAGGHTAGPEQLELWKVPPASPATSDFVCWLWAAFPQREGNLNLTRISTALEVPRTTLRRWIAANNPKLSHKQKVTLARRAILRGRGHYLWPPLDPVSRQRSALNLEYALRCDRLIRQDPAGIPPEWHENGTVSAREVHLLYFPRAHVYGVAAVTAEKSLAKLLRHGEIVETTRAGNKFAGIAIKHLTLERVEDHRCIAPRALVPTGRTETWLEAGGQPALRKRLERVKWEPPI